MAAASRARLPVKLVSQGSLSGEKVVFEHVTHLVEVAKEVPYEGLKIKRASTHKDFMKQMMLRQSGLIGTNAGKIGYLTYGSYCEKDVARMNSICVGKASAVGTGLQKMKPAPAQTVGKQLSRPKSNATVISDECSYPEIPSLVLIRKSRACNGYKSLMAQSIIRRGGLFGEKVCDGLGTIAYGSIGLGDKLEF